MGKICLYSEDRALFQLLSSALGKGVQVTIEPDEERLADLVLSANCDVMILDLNSSVESLEDRTESVRRLMGLSVPAVIMGDDAFRATAFELIREGAFSYWRRPPSIREIKVVLAQAFENSSLKRRLQSVETPPDEAAIPHPEPAGCDRLTGSSPRMQRVYELVRRVTNINTPVLVTGESGTGKELIARAIHNLGARADRPFVAVSCGAIPETLIEAELFGHEKGAFTGTVVAREGYFEKAGDGTLFLDEIGELSLLTQVKLLRVLQQMEFSKLGSSRLIPLRARLVFATNRDLPKMVAEGTFRQDLFYRINVMQIASPPLRERVEDIPLIAKRFLMHYSKMFGKHPMQIDADASALLQSYSWPGNVRELENVVQRAIILAAGASVRAQDIALNSREEDCREVVNLVDIGDYNPNSSFERHIRDYKVKLAVAAVRQHNGNKTLAARSLGITRAYVHRLIRFADADPLLEADLPLTAAASMQGS